MQSIVEDNNLRESIIASDRDASGKSDAGAGAQGEQSFKDRLEFYMEKFTIFSEKTPCVFLVTVYSIVVNIGNSYIPGEFLKFLATLNIYLDFIVLSAILIQMCSFGYFIGCYKMCAVCFPVAELDVRHQEHMEQSENEKIVYFADTLVYVQSYQQIQSLVNMLALAFAVETGIVTLKVANVLSFLYSLIMLSISAYQFKNGKDYKFIISVVMLLTIFIWIPYSTLFFILWYLTLIMERCTCCLVKISTKFLRSYIKALYFLPKFEKQRDMKIDKHEGKWQLIGGKKQKKEEADASSSSTGTV